MPRVATTLAVAFTLTLTLVGARPAAAGKLGVVGIATVDSLGSMPVLSFSFGVHPAASGAGPEFTGLTFMKPLDQYTPQLFVAAASGQVFSSARLDLYGTGGAVTSSVVLTNVTVVALNQGGSSTAGASAEEVTVTFGKVELDYTGVKGSSSASWDLQQNNTPVQPSTPPTQQNDPPVTESNPPVQPSNPPAGWDLNANKKT